MRLPLDRNCGRWLFDVLVGYLQVTQEQRGQLVRTMDQECLNR